MKAVRLFSPLSGEHSVENIQEHIRMVELPLPVLKSGEVLVEVSYSGLNPSDLSTLAGRYGKLERYQDIDQEAGLPLGYEGVGRVVATDGLIAKTLSGKRVAFYTTNGTWSSHVAIQATNAFPVPDHVPDEDACFPIVNPLTCVSMFEITKASKSGGVVITAAFSALGKMMTRYFSSKGVKVICVVRKEAQVEPLKELGSHQVFVSTTDDWNEELRQLCKELNITVAFDCVAGDLTGQILHALATEGTVYVYGSLSGANVGSLPVHSIIFEKKSVRGFLASDYIAAEKNIIGLMIWRREVPALLSTLLKTEVHKNFDYNDFAEGLSYHLNNQSAGKVSFKIPKVEVAPADPVPEDTPDEEAPADPAPEEAPADESDKAKGEEEDAE